MKRQKPFSHGLTPKQLKLAWYTIDPTCKLTLKEISKELGVGTDTLWRWRGKPEFKKYKDDLFLKYAEGEEKGIWETMIRQGNKPEGFQDRQMFFKLAGKLKDTKEITGKDGDPIKLILEE